MTPYSVFASRWDPMEQRWEPEMCVSPLRPEQWQWWCDVAVDSEGIPHVVWVAVPACTVYYSFYEHGQWQGPFPVNDSMVRAASWADPHIVIDNSGMMHVSYTGVARGATGRDIFYSRNDGSGWTPSVRVTQDTLYNYNEWYSDVVADRPDNVWVVWDRQGEGPDQFRVYATHYDGNRWSPEGRLDNDSADHDGGIEVAIEPSGLPWAVWTGTSSVGWTDYVYFNRYRSTGMLDRPGPLRSDCALLSSVPCPATGPIRVIYVVPAAAQVQLDVVNVLGRVVATLYDGRRNAGTHTAVWRSSQPPGQYLLRLRMEGVEAVNKIVLLHKS